MLPIETKKDLRLISDTLPQALRIKLSGPDPHKDCAAFAPAKSVQIRVKDDGIHKACTKGKSRKTALPGRQDPGCICPICMHAIRK